MTDSAHSSFFASTALVAAAILGACLASFSGFHQFDALHGLIASGTITLALLLNTGSGRAHDRSTLHTAGWVALAICAGWLVIAIVVQQSHGVWANALASTSPALLAGVTLLTVGGWSTAIANRFPSIPVALLITALVSMVAAGLQFSGVQFPPPIPEVTPTGGFAHAFSDDPLTATGILICMALAATAAAARSTGAASLLAAIAALLAVATTIFTAPSLAVLLIVPAAGAAGFTALKQSARPTLGVLLSTGIIAIVAALFHPAAPMRELSPDEPAAVDSAEFVEHINPEARTPFPQVSTGAALPGGDSDATRLMRDAVRRMAQDSLWLGSGAGATVLRLGEFVDADNPWAIAHPEVSPTWTRSPEPVVRWVAELGLLWVASVLAALALLLAAALRSGQTPTTHILIAAIAVVAWLVCPGADTHAGALLLAVAFGYSLLTAPGPSSVAALGHWLVPVLSAAFCLVHFQSARWSLHNAGGVQWANAGAAEEALVRFARANTIFPRFESTLNAGVMGVYNTGTSRDVVAASASLQNAARMSSGSAVARFELANHFVRSMGSTVDSEAAGEEARTNARDLLHRALELNPNSAQCGMMLGQLYLMELQPMDALAVLEGLLQRDLPRAIRTRVLIQVASVYIDVVEAPRQALAPLQEALELEQSTMARRELESRVSMVERWIETGTRPATGNGLEPEGPGAQPEGHEGHEGHEEHNPLQPEGAGHSDEGIRDLYAPGTVLENDGSGRDPHAEHDHDHAHDHDHDHDDDHSGSGAAPPSEGSP